MEPWLELRSGAPGLDGPFLLEHPIAYQVLDEQTERPDVFLAIGSKIKRRFLRRLRSGPSIKHNGVTLEELLSSTVLLDCELQDASLPRIKAGPHIESCLQHHLSTATISDISSSQDIAKCVFEFLWQALIPFTSTVLLFLDDVGGMIQLSEILATWSTQPTQCEPRIVILHDANLKVNQERFETLMWRKLGAQSLHLEPLSLRKGQTMPFESLHFLPINESAHIDVLAHVDRSASLRKKSGLAFHSEHLKDLMQQSIKQFAAGVPAPFDFYATARRCNPIAKNLAENIAHFVDISRNLHFDQPSIIASALVLDALPPQMHSKQAVNCLNDANLDRFPLRCHV